MPTELIFLIVGAMIAGFVQGLSGFAFSMVAMSFWVWGLEPRMAAVMAVFGSLSGQLVATFSERRELHLGQLVPYLAGGLAGIPLGVYLLPVLNPDVFKLILGGVLIAWCPSMLLSRELPRITFGGRAADALADYRELPW